MSYTDDYIIEQMNEQAVIDYYNEHPEQFISEEMMEQRALDNWEENNQDKLRSLFEDYLVEECCYSRSAAEESNDWYDTRLKEQFKIYNGVNL